MRCWDRPSMRHLAAQCSGCAWERAKIRTSISSAARAFGAVTVPAPSVLALMALGLGLLSVRRRMMSTALSGPTRPKAHR